MGGVKLPSPRGRGGASSFSRRGRRTEDEGERLQSSPGVSRPWIHRACAVGNVLCGIPRIAPKVSRNGAATFPTRDFDTIMNPTICRQTEALPLISIFSPRGEEAGFITLGQQSPTGAMKESMQERYPLFQSASPPRSLQVRSLPHRRLSAKSEVESTSR